MSEVSGVDAVDGIFADHNGLLFSPKRVRRPGPKGPSKELIDAVVEMKRRNRTWGCKRIAQQIALAFGIEIDKDVVRRILGIHFRPEAGSGGPSWLSFIGHAQDSLWSLDLFRCESAMLRTYWVLAVMDQFTDGLSALPFTVALWMAWHYAG
ncbi:MAG TPA: helix-turn-helix domain-containing protein [Terriglobales bacterium]